MYISLNLFITLKIIKKVINKTISQLKLYFRKLCLRNVIFIIQLYLLTDISL